MHRRRARRPSSCQTRVRRADRAAGIARRRLHVDVAGTASQRDLAVGHRVHPAAAGERDGVEPVPRVQRVEQVEERLLVHRLHRARDVPVALLERLVLAARPARAAPPAPANTACPTVGEPSSHS